VALPDAGTERTNRGIANRGYGSRGVPDIGQRAITPPPRAPTATVGTLLIYTKGFEKKKVDLYNEAHFSSAAKTKAVDSWSDVVGTLREYKSINKLVLLMHSNPGTFLFGPDPTETRFRTSKRLADAATELTALAPKAQVQSLDLAGCNVGFDMDGVVQFGLALGAAEAISINHFHEFALDRLQSGPRTSAELEKHLLSLRGYVTSPGTDALVEQAKKAPVDKTVLLEWYVVSDEDHRRVLPTSGVDGNQRAKTFKNGSEAFNVIVDSQKSLEALKNDMAQFGGREPFRQLMRITVKLDGFRQATDAGLPAAAGQPTEPEAQPRDAGRFRPPARPSPPSRDAGRFAPLATDRSRRLTSAFAGQLPPKSLEPKDQAIVDEAFRRDASVQDAMGILYSRALDKTGIGTPPVGDPLVAMAQRGGAAGAGPGGVRDTRRPRFTLEDRTLLQERDLSEIQQRRSDEVDALRPLVQARFDAYVAATKREFDSLPPDVRANFEPIRKAPYIDPYSNAEEKYRAMRGAYYRAGWTCMKRDVFDQMVPTRFFGVKVVGGTHRELRDLLSLVENDVQNHNEGVANRSVATGFVIGGFVPRLIAGSDQLSQHAFGLAIDIDPTWNPQLKSPAVRKAFKQATGDDIGKWLYSASSLDEVGQTYKRVQAMSDKLKVWLNDSIPKYEQLQEQRLAAQREKDGKDKLAAIDKELANNPDLAALKTLIDEYKMPTVQSWRVHGVITIPPVVISSFVRLGKGNGARWGGMYDNTKDNMHLELMRLSTNSLARPGGPGRRKAVIGLNDLIRGDPPRAPDCSPPSAPREVPVAPLR
jgi:hypothetical protein